MKIEDYKLG